MMVNRSTFNIYKLGYRELGIQDGLPNARTTRTGCGHPSQEEYRQEDDLQEEVPRGALAHCRGTTREGTSILRCDQHGEDPWYLYRLHRGHEDPRRSAAHHPNGRCGDYSVLRRGQ